MIWPLGWGGNWKCDPEVPYRTLRGHYTVTFATDRKGNSTCRWRVGIAPHLPTEHPFQRQDLTQLWDSEFNVRLGQRIPDVFVSPLVTNPPTATETHVFSVRDSNIILRAEAVEDAATLENGMSDGLLVAYLPNHTAHWAAPVDIALKHLQDEVFTATPESPVVLLFAAGKIMPLDAPVDPEIEGFVVARRSKSSIRP